MRKICFITSTRADYGIMSQLMRKINDDNDLQLQIIATNMHLSPEFGLTYKEIEEDGFHIDKKIEMMLSSDTDCSTVKSMGVELLGIGDAISELCPDLIVLLGDRSEILQAAVAALILKIPVAHIGGGDITEGAYDDAIRHCITKLSHLHFASSEQNRQRIIQMGEQPDNVYFVGSIAIDNMMQEKLLTKEELEENLNFSFGYKSIHIAFHPVTMEQNTAETEIDTLLKVLDNYNDYQLLFTYPNSDGGGRIIRKKIDKFVKNHSNSIAFASLGRKRFYSMLNCITVMIGNSSSGIYEAPSFKVPTLNIGNRQKGRLQGNTIINSDPSYDSIYEGLKQVTNKNFIDYCHNEGYNPYEKSNSLSMIFNIIKNHRLEGLVNKHFYDINILNS